MTTEPEAKLIPKNGFRMPSLDGLLPTGAVSVAQPARELDATYYDTADFELARWGITLRHRRGESGPPWTLKLPKHRAGAVIARDEWRFDGEIYAVPDEARDLPPRPRRPVTTRWIASCSSSRSGSHRTEEDRAAIAAKHASERGEDRSVVRFDAPTRDLGVAAC